MTEAFPMLKTSLPASAVMEIVHFKNDKTVSEQDFARRFECAASIVRAQPGFLARQLIRAGDGVWTDLVLWRSRQEAMAAATVVTADPRFADYMAAIRGESVAMAHHRVIATMAVDG